MMSPACIALRLSLDLNFSYNFKVKHNFPVWALFSLCSAPLAICYKHLPRVNKGYLFIYFIFYTIPVITVIFITETESITVDNRFFV